MNTKYIVTNKTFTFEQLAKKPLFTQPSCYKMAEQELEMVSDDELSMDENVCEQNSFEEASQSIFKIFGQASAEQCQDKDQEQYSSVSSVLDNQNLINDKTVELPAIASVSRGLWRAMSYSSKSVNVEDIILDKIIESDSAKQTEEESVQKDEVLEESEEEELEDIDDAIAKMNSLIKDQNVSKASRFPKIIRESAEFSKDDI